MAEIHAEDRVAVWQPLRAGHQAERIARQIVFVQLPHHFFLSVEFNHFVSVAASDQEMAVRQREHAVRVAGHFDRAEHFALCVQFDDFSLALEAHEIVAICQLASSPELVVQLHLWRSRELDFFCNLPFAIHFDDAAGPALDDEHLSVRQRLAAVNLHLHIRGSLVLPDDLAFRRQLDRAAHKGEQRIPIWQPPAVLRALARVFPRDFSVRGDLRHFPSAVVATDKRMRSPRGGSGENEKEEEGGELGGRHLFLWIKHWQQASETSLRSAASSFPIAERTGSEMGVNRDLYLAGEYGTN